MLHYIHNNKLSHGPIHLVFGTRTQNDALYRDEMEKLAETMPDFYYHLTLSREKWEGRQGYVHDVYEQLSAQLPEAQFMLCGWKDMIDEAKQRIMDLGYDKKQIHLELYG
jgi:CDP-4-dehydro-6-deoxyglucose reductase